MLKVSRVPRCCLWTNRSALSQVCPIPAYISYFCSIQQRYILQVRWTQACLLQQNLLSPVQNQRGIYFTPGKQKPVWLKYGQIHFSSLKSETKTGKKSVTGIKAAVQQSLVCIFCVMLVVREAAYTCPWDDKWRLNETIHVEFHLYPEHILLWNEHWISIPGPWKTKPPSETSGVWRTCRGCCNLALGRLSMAVSWSKKAKTKILIFKCVFPSWLWCCPCADCCASPGEWHAHPPVFSMGSGWATVSLQLLRLLNFLELSEHVELCQCSQARNACLNEKILLIYFICVVSYWF